MLKTLFNLFEWNCYKYITRYFDFFMGTSCSLITTYGLLEKLIDQSYISMARLQLYASMLIMWSKINDEKKISQRNSKKLQSEGENDIQVARKTNPLQNQYSLDAFKSMCLISKCARKLLMTPNDTLVELTSSPVGTRFFFSPLLNLLNVCLHNNCIESDWK